jgi:hypothetical protein
MKPERFSHHERVLPKTHRQLRGIKSTFFDTLVYFFLLTIVGLVYWTLGRYKQKPFPLMASYFLNGCRDD